MPKWRGYRTDILKEISSKLKAVSHTNYFNKVKIMHSKVDGFIKKLLILGVMCLEVSSDFQELTTEIGHTSNS